MTNRKQNAVKAILHIYRQAIDKLQDTIRNINDETLAVIIDPHTADEDCRSVQSILSHVVYSGYGYATNIHNLGNDIITRPARTVRDNIGAYLKDLDNVFTYTEDVFKSIYDDELEQMNEVSKIKTGWGQVYDIEQMMEHAIVHILRHEYQIARMIKQHAELRSSAVKQ